MLYIWGCVQRLVWSTLFDSNCRLVRVPCLRWSWTTTWDWNNSLQLDSWRSPPAREISRQSLRWARRSTFCNCCCSFLSTSSGVWFRFPVLPSEVNLHLFMWLPLNTSAIFASMRQILGQIKWTQGRGTRWMLIENVYLQNVETPPCAFFQNR